MSDLRRENWKSGSDSPHTRGRGTVPAASHRAHTHDVRVNGARDAVVDLEVELRENVFCKPGGRARVSGTASYDQRGAAKWCDVVEHTGVDGSLREIPDGGRLDHVANGEAANSLVL